MGVLRPQLPLVANGPANMQNESALETTRLAAEAPPTLRRVGRPLVAGSLFLPADPGVVVRDPYFEGLLPPRDVDEPPEPPAEEITYRLTLAPAADTVTLGTAVSFTATLMEHRASTGLTPASGKTIKLYQLVTPPTGGPATRSLVGTGVTGSAGTCTVRHTPMGTASYEAVFFAADGSQAAVSNRSVITVVTRR